MKVPTIILNYLILAFNLLDDSASKSGDDKSELGNVFQSLSISEVDFRLVGARYRVFKPVALVMVLLLSLSACHKVGDCFKSTGKVVRAERMVADFDSIKVEDNVELILIQDSVYRVEIEAGEHLQSEINCISENGRLLLNNKNACNWVRKFDIPIKAYVHFKDLRLITHKSVMDVSSPDSLILDKHDFELRTISSGDFKVKGRFKELIINMWVVAGSTYVSGKADATVIWCVGSGKVDLRNLESRFVGIHTDTPADSYLFCTENLVSEITWTGNVYYKGSPFVATNKESSSGRLIAWN